MIAIIGDRGKRRRYDPDLAEKINRELKEEERRLRQESEEMKNEGLGPVMLYPKNIEDICRGYEEFMELNQELVIPTEITDKFNPTKKQIFEFSRRLVDYKDLKEFVRNTANYLTALMHSSEDDDFFIDFTKLNKKGIKLDYIGCLLENKKLGVYGNARDFVGDSAKDSKIIVNGDAGDCVGRRGERLGIIIDGNAGNGLGSNAISSKIIVNGNAAGCVGLHSKNSEIIVNRDAGMYVGNYAENSIIKIRGSIQSLADTIGEGTKVYKGNGIGRWNQVYPK